MGRRPNGLSPVDAAKIEGVEVIHNGLGTGVLLDEDGNYTSDDNKQKGSVAMNINGLGAYVNDDLCIIDVEVAVSTVGPSELLESDKSGFVSFSPASPLTVSVVAAATAWASFCAVATPHPSTSTAIKPYVFLFIFIQTL